MRQSHAARVAFKERNAQILLEFFDRFSDRRLGNVQTLGRAAEEFLKS